MLTREKEETGDREKRERKGQEETRVRRKGVCFLICLIFLLNPLISLVLQLSSVPAPSRKDSPIIPEKFAEISRNFARTSGSVRDIADEGATEDLVFAPMR